MAFWTELGESTSLLCDPGCKQTLTFSAMNFSDQAWAQVLSIEWDRDVSPQQGKAQAAALALPLQQ